MIRRVLIPCCLLATLLSAPGDVTGQLHLDAPAIPEQPYEQTLNWLDEQISSRSSRMNGLSDADRVVLSSQQQYRRIARRLLIVGHEAGADGAIATMSAQMLINSAKTFDQLVEPLPDRVRVMLSQREIDPHEMQGLSQAVRALRQFNAFNDVQIDALTEANAESVDAYLKQMLAPLATLAVHLDHGSPQTTWVSLSTGTTNGYRQAKILPSHIAALQHRIDQTRMNTALWEHHAQILAMMQRATDSPHLQPHLQMFHRELNRLLDIEQTLNDADWLTPGARGDLKRQSATAAVLLKDPATRAEAHRIIDHLSRMLETLHAIDGVATHNIDVAPMRDVLLIAYRLSEQPQTAPTAEALLDYLERLCVTIDQQQQMRPDDLPLDIRKVFSVIQRQYAAEQKHLMITLPALTAAPHTVTQPRWSEPLARLERLHQQTVRLHSVPHWLDRMNRLNPHASRGLYQQLRLIAADLLNEPNNAGAAEALDQLELQLTLFEALPYESQIIPSHASVSKLTGGTLLDIQQQLFILRSQWAAAWSAGSDPSVYGQRLMQLRRLYVYIHNTHALVNKPKSLHKLNRWAAWEMSTDAIKPLIDDLPDRIEVACGLAATGQWEQLEAALDELDQEAAVARLTAHLAGRMCDPMKAQPPGMSGVLGQCLFTPDENAFASDQRLAIAQLSVLINAAHQSEQTGRVDAADRLRRAANELADRILRQLHVNPTGVDHV